MKRTKKLIELIEEAGKRKDFDWFSAVELGKAQFVVRDATEVAPSANLRNTYGIRAEINRDRGNPVKGFETFIENLNATKHDFLNIHQMVDADENEYRIFTDPNITELVGILKLMK